jgi:uncharacterized protein YjiS (DUF1127 family)
MEMQMTSVNIHHMLADRPANRQRFGFAQAIDFAMAVAKRRKHRRELNHLIALSDYLLDDVGLTRDDVHRELSDVVAGK